MARVRYIDRKIVCIFLFLSSFLKPQILGAKAPPDPTLTTALNLDFLFYPSNDKDKKIYFNFTNL